jgi:uncharacterized membrane protein YhaH (DUF805 family)
MSATVQLVFLGEVLSGFRLEDVQRDLGRALKADEAKLKALFSGRRAVLKRGLPEAEAPRYVARLAALGARIHIEPTPETATAMAAATSAQGSESAWPTIAPPPETDRHAAPAAPGPAPIAARPVPVASPPAAPMSRAADATELALQPLETPAVDEVTCPKCGERQTRRLLCRGCATNIEMAIASQREDEERRRAERQAALEALRAQRRGRVHDDEGRVSTAWPIGFGFSGRVARLPSTTANVWLFTALLLLTVGFLQRPTLPRALLMGVGALGVFFFTMRLTVLRCHDCDRHGWWALMVLVPYVGSLASLLITFLPGNPDVNEYGPPPPRGRWRWLVVALAVFAVSFVMLVRAGMGFSERLAEQQHKHEQEHADDVIELGTTDVAPSDINEAFQRDYAQAQPNKAFAAASKQVWGWSGNASSVQQAVRDALAQCNAKRPAYTAECHVININGQGPR